MTALDYLNAFHLASDISEFSPNMRSLYFAIWGEFNRLHYPATAKLSNSHLQHLSGIKSSHSFDSARCALINAGFISYDKRRKFYQLQGISRQEVGKIAESVPKSHGKPAENLCRSINAIKVLDIKAKKDEDEDEDGRASASAALNSHEVIKTWQLWNGEILRGGVAFVFADLEKKFGTEELCRAIEDAGKFNTRERLSVNLVEHILKRRAKIEEKLAQVAKRETEAWENTLPDWLEA